MKARFRYTALLAVSALIFSKFPPPPFASAAVATEWNRKVEIQIQETYIDATLLNFPILLTEENVPSEACDADGSSPAQNGGGDIRFTADEDGNEQIPLEIVKYVTDANPTNCDIEMYVKVPAISGSVNTSIWMWYNTTETNDQSTASSTYGSENVWTAYSAVWHLQESSGTRYDSTGNDNDLTDNNTVATGSGKIGNAADIERSNTESLSILDANQTGLDLTSDISISFWWNPESLPGEGEYFGVVTKAAQPDQQSWRLYYQNDDPSSDDQWGFHSTPDGENGVERLADQTLSTSTWYYGQSQYDASAGEWAMFVNNSQVSTTQTGIHTSLFSGSAPVYLGGYLAGNNGIDGLMDEVRISSMDMSNDWRKAEYNNQNSPSLFAIEQSPVEASTAPVQQSEVKPADESVTNSSVLQNDDHFFFELDANSTYVLSSGIFATSTSGNPDIKIGFSAPSGASLDIGYLAQGGSNRSAELLEESGVASSRIAIPANGNTIIQAFGSIVTGSTGGTLNFQWAQFSSNATAVKVKQGSFISVTKVTEE